MQVRTQDGRNRAQASRQSDKDSATPDVLGDALAALERAPFGVTWVGRDGVIIHANDAQLALVRRRPDAYIGRSLAELVVSEHDAAAQRIQAGEQLAGVLLDIRRPDGTVAHLEIDTSPSLRDGELVANVCFARDLSRQDAALVHAVEAEQRRALANSVPFLTWLADVDGNLTYVNPRWSAYAGASVQECVAAGWHGILHPNDAALQPQAFNERTEQVLRHRLRRHDGEYRWHQTTAVPVQTGGEFRGWLGSSIDVHGEVVAEEGLRESEQRFRGIVETANEGVLMLDADGAITYANSRVAGILGYPREMLVGHRLHEFMDAEMAAVVEENLGRRRRGLSEHFDFRFRHRDGSDVWTIVGATPLWSGTGTYAGSLALITDITERKRQEQQIRDSEARLRSAQEAARVGTFEWDVLTGDVVWDGVEPIHGLEPGAFGGNFEAYLADVYEDDRDHVVSAINRAVEECGAIDLEYRIVWPDGSVHWVAGKGHAFADESGRTVRVAGTCQDITERKTVELALRESEGRYRVLVRAMPANVSITDPSGQVVYAGEGWSAYTGLDEASLLGMRWVSTVHPDDRERVLQDYTTAIDARTVYEGEFRVLGADGNYRWFMGRALPYFDAEGAVEGWIGMSLDVHERRRAEDALRESEERYRSLAELVPAMVSLHTLNGHTVFANRRLLEYTGRTLDQLGQGQWTDIFHPDDLAAHREEWLAAIARGDTIEGEFRARRHDGEYFWHLGRVAPVRDADGRVIFWIAAHVDIHERKQTESALNARVRQQASVAALGQLALSSDDPRAVMDEAVRQLRDCLDVDYTMVLELQPSGSELVLRGGLGWPGQVRVGVSTVTAGPESQAGYTMQSASAVIVDDLRAETRFKGSDLLRDAGVISGMSTVIQGVGGRPYGVLGVHSRSHRGFTPDDLNYVQSVASIIGQAVQRQRSDAVLNLRVAQQASVARLGQTALPASFDDLVEQAIEELSLRLGVEFVKLLEVLPDGESLRLYAGRGWQEGLVGSLVLDAHESQAGYSLLSSKPVIVDDLRADKRFRGPSFLVDHGVVSGMSTIIRGEQGKPWGVVGVHTRQHRTFEPDDLHYLESVANIIGQAVQRRAYEQALVAALAETEQSRGLLDTLLTAAPVGFVVLDREGRFILVNDEAARINGIAADAHIGQRVEEVLPHLEPQFPYIERVLRGEVVRYVEVSGETPAQPGVTRYWLASYYPVYEGDTVIAAGIAFSEITERRRIEDQLRHQNQLNQTITENAAVGLLMMDADGRITFMNPAAETITGYSAGEAVGAIAHDITHSRRPDGTPYPRTECPILAANAAQLRVRNHEDVFVRPDGSLYDVVCNLAPVGAIGRGSAGGMLIEIRDVTREKRANKEREQLLADLSRALAAKDEFLGLVSHELKTPITTIYGNSEVLRRRGDRLDEVSRAEAIADISKESERLHRIIDNLLVLARLERGQQLASEPVLVHRITQRLVDEHQHRFPHRKISLAIADDVGPAAGEPLYIEQVIRNLLSNAEKYSPPDMPIEVEVAANSDGVTVRVLDRGPGFPEEEAERLFTPFYRSSTTAAHASGVGIGLAVCRRLIEAQYGAMWARPRPDGGADLGFSLPLAENSD